MTKYHCSNDDCSYATPHVEETGEICRECRAGAITEER